MAVEKVTNTPYSGRSIASVAMPKYSIRYVLRRLDVLVSVSIITLNVINITRHTFLPRG